MRKDEKVTLTLEDGSVMEFETAQQLRKYLNTILKKPRTKGTGFCPTLDCDEEGFVKEIEDGFPGIQAGTRTVTVEQWYSSKKCPRCKKVHEFPMQAKFRP